MSRNDQSDGQSDDPIDYDALAAQLTDPSTRLQPPRRAATGRDAARAGQEFLLREYGSQGAIDQVLRGRPKVGQAKGASPTVRARISESDYAAFKQLEQDSGLSQSDLVREAVHRLLTDHKLVS
jgi:hypothetical protein